MHSENQGAPSGPLLLNGRELNLGPHIETGFHQYKAFGTAIQQSIMPLLTKVDGDYRLVGTAFAIHPDGLLMTATHVLREAHRSGTDKFEPTTCSTSRIYELHALYSSDLPAGDGTGNFVGGLISVSLVAADDNHDIALCPLNMPTWKNTGKQLRLPAWRLKLDPPNVGDEVNAIGYHGEPRATSEFAKGSKAVSCSWSISSTSGQIVEVHPTKRDGGLLKWPCFETNARTEHGLSGGPIFHKDGAVCGVVCSKTPSRDSSGHYCYYGSLIWPSLGIRLRNPGAEEDWHPDYRRFFDLIRAGGINVHGDINAFEIEESSDGTATVRNRTR